MTYNSWEHETKAQDPVSLNGFTGSCAFYVSESPFSKYLRYGAHPQGSLVP